MPQLLTTNAQILCPHGGKGTTVPSAPKWQINGGYVCVAGDAGTLACPFLPYPCVGYTLQSMGLNATTIDHRQAMLVTDFNKSVTGLPLLMIETHQVFDESTPAPIPAGQPAPPVSAPMADLVAPTVSVPPAPFPFSVSVPAPVVITFSLAAQHPLKWVLTFIDETPPGQNIDLTNGLPGAVTVAPSGGQWTTPALTVVVTLTPAFLAGLGPGKKDLFLTGVSQRGLSGHDAATIMVGP
jgi:hypothetical protein